MRGADGRKEHIYVFAFLANFKGLFVVARARVAQARSSLEKVIDLLAFIQVLMSLEITEQF